MIEVVRAILLSVVATGAFVVILVLPGVRLADRLAGPRSSVAARLVLAFVMSQLLVAAIGVLLVAVGRFSGLAVTIVAIALAATGVPVLIRWSRGLRSAWPTAGWIALLGVPWVAFVGASGWPPADTLQWYYAGLGSQLSATGGIPASVAEWGMSVRWLPDYLVFNFDSEAYLTLMSFVPRADALAAWRVPVAILGLLLLFFVFRLWLGRPSAVAGVVVTAGTTFFLAKFDAYKPEALGIVVGLAALWLVVNGLRRGRRSWILAAGAAMGVALSIHAIAATVMGLIVAGFAAVEWIVLRRDRLPRLGWLIRAAALGFLISVVMGAGVQGRPIVASAALNPASVAGTDPTWTFFVRSTGDFREPQRPPPDRPLAGGVTSPWPGFQVVSAFGWWLLPVVGVGLAFLFGLGGRRGRTAVVGVVAAGALVGAGVLFFALRFDTYVPRWTGLVRFGQYVPLLAGIAVAFAAAGYLRAWSWLAERRVPRVLPLIAAIAGGAWLLPIAINQYSAEPRIAANGSAALAMLRQLGRPGDVVLSNALTTGTVEAFSGLEDPLEGRQPLIEQPAFLAATNALLLDTHQWFVNPTDDTLIRQLAVRWVLAADDPATLGATASLGGTVASLRTTTQLRETWSDGGIALFEVVNPNPAAAVIDRLVPVIDLGRIAIVGLLGVVVGAVLVLPTGWYGRIRSRSWMRRRNRS
ncbi:MAG TPA: glycosyltransferase family 39 protein [Candidatus Bathyarchaeia archaeon]|nr:glycosyltransferase family 39 protein [Candidatus Bathyarchaeia archaeon]